MKKYCITVVRHSPVRDYRCTYIVYPKHFGSVLNYCREENIDILEIKII